MTLLGNLGRLALLAGLGYLGFYVYGVVMGVFSPVELIGFTILAVVFAAAFILHQVQLRRAMKTPGEHEAMMRQAHVYRERRGF
jgi:hypothetical protein